MVLKFLLDICFSINEINNIASSKSFVILSFEKSDAPA
jgi:hypothetical protein